MRNLTYQEQNMLTLSKFARKHENLAIALMLLLIPVLPLIVLMVETGRGFIQGVKIMTEETKENATLLMKVIKLKFSKKGN